MRVAITFIGFLGMLTHFLQKTNVSIGLICMVNNSAIQHHQANRTKTIISRTDDECPQMNSSSRIVNRQNENFH
jgi:hypothetical protein